MFHAHLKPLTCLYPCSCIYIPFSGFLSRIPLPWTLFFLIPHFMIQAHVSRTTLLYIILMLFWKKKKKNVSLQLLCFALLFLLDKKYMIDATGLVVSFAHIRAWELNSNLGSFSQKSHWNEYSGIWSSGSR